jgi:Family of unknown function (DUF5327)
MNISVNRLLDKIGDELTEAKKVDSEAKIRERVYAIKAICELILEESSVTRRTETISRSNQVVPPMPLMEPIQVPQVPQQNRLKTDDGANGESLLDF